MRPGVFRVADLDLRESFLQFMCSMLTVKTATWQQTPEMLREYALQSDHPRTRERFMALYEITQGQSSTQVAYQSKRNPQTVMDWVHRYNTGGPEALAYRHSGGHPPLCLMPLKQG